MHRSVTVLRVFGWIRMKRMQIRNTVTMDDGNEYSGGYIYDHLNYISYFHPTIIYYGSLCMCMGTHNFEYTVRYALYVQVAFSCHFRKTIITILILTTQQGCKWLDMYGFAASPQNMLKRILVRPFSYCVKFELPGPSVRFFPARHKLTVIR